MEMEIEMEIEIKKEGDEDEDSDGDRDGDRDGVMKFKNWMTEGKRKTEIVITYKRIQNKKKSQRSGAKQIEERYKILEHKKQKMR